LRCSDGVDERLSRLIELGLRWRGLRGGTFPFGDDVALFCFPRFCAGEEGCGDEGRAVDEAVLIERRFKDCESKSFVDGGNGAESIDSFTTLICDE
jgi:hypothetical protein